jgi:N6-L-threonylcarbamoyladenine synthase
LQYTGYKRLVVAGGVSANTYLREQLDRFMQQSGGQVFYPSLAYCTDNGAMIAYAGLQRLLALQTTPLDAQVLPRWPLDSLTIDMADK